MKIEYNKKELANEPNLSATQIAEIFWNKAKQNSKKEYW